MFRRISVEGPPRERGRQYGAQAGDLIEKSIDLYQDAFTHRTGWQWARVREAAASFLPSIAGFSVTAMAEIEGIAEGAALDPLDIVAINTRTEIMFSAAECTTVAVVSPVGQVFVGQNWDWLAGASETTVVIQARCPEARNYLTVVEAGLLAKTGMNSAGVAIVTNALVAQTAGRLASGVPYHVILRALLEQPTTSACVAVIRNTVRSASGNFMIADPAGHVANLETAPGSAENVYTHVPDDGLLAHTNHFTSPRFDGVDLLLKEMPDSPMRLSRLHTLASERARGHEFEFLQAVFADHDGYPTSVCTHVDPAARARADQWATVAGVILEPVARRAWIAAGNPCTTPYELLDCDELLSDAT